MKYHIIADEPKGINMGYYITNAQVFIDGVFKTQLAVHIRKSQIVEIIAADQVPSEASRIDAGLQYLIPAPLDLQIYGAGGHLFSAELTAESIHAIGEAVQNAGTGGILLTLATNELGVFYRAIDVFRNHPHPAVLGLHLEGPFLHPKRRGAHPEEYILEPDPEIISALLEHGKDVVKMMTIAPERFSKESLNLLKNSGWLLSIGHSDANFREASQFFGNGTVQTATHLFNAMPPFHHREPGLVGAVFQSQRVSASLIADGIHISYETLSIAKKLLGERAFLITDAVTPCTSGPYQHQFEKDRYVLPDGTLSGSALTMVQAIRNCVRYAGIPLEETLKMATLYPAKLLGREDLGAIKVGAKANLLLLDKALQLQGLYFDGVRRNVEV